MSFKTTENSFVFSQRPWALLVKTVKRTSDCTEALYTLIVKYAVFLLKCKTLCLRLLINLIEIWYFPDRLTSKGRLALHLLQKDLTTSDKIALLNWQINFLLLTAIRENTYWSQQVKQARIVPQ
ncbi:MAG TPA: hypothetical protein DCY88_14790 [Cyanobacteria bacterium UBA11372]|nr:hypothetical protein [Cyanobacteria bacterium UBA11372]